MEEWKPIARVNNKYLVSNYGRIKSVKSGKIRAQRIFDGYSYISLKDSVGKMITMQVHRIVKVTFHPIDNLRSYQVHHKDHIRSNNHIDNLEWIPVGQSHRSPSLRSLYRQLLSKYTSEKLVEKLGELLNSPS